MIELSNLNDQTLAANQSVVFDIEILHTGCAECHRPNTGSIALTQKNAIYEVSYNGNIGATTAGSPAQIAIALNGSPLLETTAIVPTAAAGDLTNVSAETFIPTCCCNVANSITLTNTGTDPITFAANGRLSVKRKA